MAGAASSFQDEDGGVISDINVTPLVDVTLVLLIVFMITVPAIVGSSPIKVDVPESSSGEIGEVEQLPLNLFLKREEGGEIALYVNETRTADEEAFRSLIKSIRQPGIEQPVFLSADKSIAYAEVVKVIDILGQMNMHKLSLMTKHVNGK